MDWPLFLNRNCKCFWGAHLFYPNLENIFSMYIFKCRIEKNICLIITLNRRFSILWWLAILIPISSLSNLCCFAWPCFFWLLNGFRQHDFKGWSMAYMNRNHWSHKLILNIISCSMRSTWKCLHYNCIWCIAKAYEF